MTRTRLRFEGHIAGTGSSSGLRVVVGRWDSSPYGAFADVMLETAAGHRVLIAPDAEVADFVASTYAFDEVRIAPVDVVDLRDEGPHPGWRVETDSLVLSIGVGRRTLLGSLLKVVPRRVAVTQAWSRVTDPVSRLTVRGVRTRGSAGGGRLEVYAATDTRRVTSVSGEFDGVDVGALAPVDPPCRFGFSSAPRTPSVTEVVTTVVMPARRASP